MRRLFLPVAVVGAGLWLFLFWSSSIVTADTPVLVLAADDVVLPLPVSPNVDRITRDLSIEFNTAAATTTDARIADALYLWSQDDQLLREVATAPVEMFGSGAAAATATAVYDIELTRDVVTVIVSTVELVPGYGSTAVSRDHEDGHALINRTIAHRCSSTALRDSVDGGRQGESLINGIIARLGISSDPVHALYHTYVAGAGYGQHIGLAEKALDELAGCS